MLDQNCTGLKTEVMHFQSHVEKKSAASNKRNRAYNTVSDVVSVSFSVFGYGACFIRYMFGYAACLDTLA